MVISRAFSVPAAPCITIPTPDPAHAGIGSITNGVDSEMGFGLLLGVGADIRVGRNVSLTPFCNGFAMRSSEYDFNVGQLGLAVTIH